MQNENFDSNKRKLELAKLYAEVLKLKRETNEIDLSMAGKPAANRLEKWKLIPAYLGVFATLALFSFQSYQYFEEKRKEQKIEFDAKMIELAERLGDRENERLQRTAALQLALFGAPATPLLIESIDFDPSRPVLAAICKALVSIAKQIDGGTEEVIERLEAATNAVARRELRKESPDVQKIGRHVGALTHVAGDLVAGSAADYSASRRKIHKTLSALEVDFGKLTNSTVDVEDVDRVLRKITEGKKRLGNGKSRDLNAGKT